jgi:rhodanese-related sulfurtransferase
VVELLKQPGVFLIDVRPQDYTKGPEFIKGAHHCPLLHLGDRINTLPKDKRIIVTDWRMQQSLLAAKYLMANGFKVIGVIRGGTMRWSSENLPVETRTVETKTP